MKPLHCLGLVDVVTLHDDFGFVQLLLADVPLPNPFDLGQGGQEVGDLLNLVGEVGDGDLVVRAVSPHAAALLAGQGAEMMVMAHGEGISGRRMPGQGKWCELKPVVFVTEGLPLPA